MNETYAEFLVKRKTPAYAYVLNAVLVVLTLISVFLAFTTNVFAVIIMFAVGFVTYLSFRNTRVEYEYLFVTGILSVDKVLGQSARKKVFECTIEDIQIIAPTGSPVLNDYKVQNQKVLDCSSRKEGAKTYTAIVQAGSDNTKLIFEPNDKMLQCLYMAAPRKIKKQ